MFPTITRLMHRMADFVWQRLADLISGELKQAELSLLVSPHRHLSLLTRRRATMIVNRVRLIALLFAILTPLWSVIDLLVFPYPLWLTLAAMRVMASAVFFSLLLHYRPNGDLFDAYRAMALLFAIPTTFYIASYSVLSHYHLTGMAAAIGAGYGFLPFVLLAGLAIFPLTLLESMLIASPILLAQGLAGSLNWATLDWPTFVGAFWLLMLITSVSTLASMSQLSFMIALVRQAIRDPLTRVFSRRSGEEVLDLQFTIANRSQAPLSVAFIDLDHFKSINDKFGHDAGDQALLDMTGIVSSNLRRGDMLVRWGGEEFLLIMPNTDLIQAEAALFRMRSIGFGMRPDSTPLTASIGIAERSADQLTDWKGLVGLADQRMYLAKQGGRNRVMGRTQAQEH
ncbi:GGDEF domain-containing protein [Rhodoferax sp. UBA5149]|uniref:GGDEF domain-containing protein n=1 Tax=Rhodoferax sp. UBA5149 TaxID=1947379 RepID=UPI0025DFED73|nr:GGDEF domain-containing protein [Rhodoferax sp. UBA5149]